MKNIVRRDQKRRNLFYKNELKRVQYKSIIKDFSIPGETKDQCVYKCGWVTGTARPVHRGRATQVWQIDLTNEDGELTCVSRITMAVLAPRGG